jgi:hypothetical protein
MLALLGSLIWLINRLFPETNLSNGPHVGRLSFAFGVAMLSLAICYGLLLLLVGLKGLMTLELVCFVDASRRGR